MAVVSKILLEGIEASAKLFGHYIETYLHTEEELWVSLTDNIGIDEYQNYDYNVSNAINVLLHQIWFIIKCPFVGLGEMGSAGINSFIRDSGKTKNNQITPKKFNNGLNRLN